MELENLIREIVRDEIRNYLEGSQVLGGRVREVPFVLEEPKNSDDLDWIVEEVFRRG